MKKIVLSLIILITAISCKTQTIVLEDHYANRTDLDDGTYVKDVNGVLDKFIGTWIGTYQGKTFEFRIEKFKHEFLNIAIDELRLRYKITDSNGTVIEDSLNEPNDGYIIKGDYYEPNGDGYVLGYYGRENSCELNGSLFISVGYDNNPNKMKVHVTPDHDTYIEDPNCPNGDTMPKIPRQQVTLYR